MISDRIIKPEQIGELIREYLSGGLDGFAVAHSAMLLAGSTDRILAGHQTHLVKEAYWALRRLAETDGPHRPDKDRMQYLLDCVEGRRRYHDLG